MSDPGPWLSHPVTLADGTPVEAGPVTAEDRPRLQAALAELSPASRFQRFLSHLDRFSPDQLRFLTSQDGVNHLACCLWLREADGRRVDLGVARCVRLPEAPDCAEVAVVVADAWHGRGVGTALLRELRDRGWRVGIRRWRAEMLAENEAVRRLFRRFGRCTDISYPEPGVLVAHYTLDPPGSAAP